MREVNYFCLFAQYQPFQACGRRGCRKLSDTENNFPGELIYLHSVHMLCNKEERGVRLRDTALSLLEQCEALLSIGALFSGWGAPPGRPVSPGKAPQLLVTQCCHPAEKSLAEDVSQTSLGHHSWVE